MQVSGRRAQHCVPGPQQANQGYLFGPGQEAVADDLRGLLLPAGLGLGGEGVRPALQLRALLHPDHVRRGRPHPRAGGGRGGSATPTPTPNPHSQPPPRAFPGPHLECPQPPPPGSTPTDPIRRRRPRSRKGGVEGRDQGIGLGWMQPKGTGMRQTCDDHGFVGGCGTDPNSEPDPQ